MKNIAIIGNGAYGTALAYLLGKKHSVTVFGRIPKGQESSIDIFGEDGEVYDYLIFSITTRAFGLVLEEVVSRIHPSTHVILAMKGLTESGLLPIDECEMIKTTHRITVLSGPGFAEDILSDVPVHLVLTGSEIHEYEKYDFEIPGLIIDYSHDVYGVSWCGVLKNIYAIGAGMLSVNGKFVRDAYVESVVAELSTILRDWGYDESTALGPAGKGDIWICTTPSSPNFRYGAGDITLRDVAEGYNAGKHISENFSKQLHLGIYPILKNILNQL